MKKQQNFDPNNETFVVNNKSKVPSWLKILLLKYWTAGAVLYFFGFGLGLLWASTTNLENQTIYLAVLLILGYCLINEYIVKPIVRLFKSSNDDTYYYNMINLKGTKSFFLNLGYSIIVIIPTVIIMSQMAAHGITLDITFQGGIDPFSFALVVVIIDFIYLFIKNTIMNFIKKRKFNKDNKIKNEEL